MPLEPKQRPRIEPLEPPYDPEVSAALERLGPPIALFRVLARRPPLAHAMASWGRYYLSPESSSIPARLREIAIARTAALCGADYEWGVHIAFFAERVGLSADQVRSLAAGNATDVCWLDPTDQVVVRTVDELHRGHDVPDELWEGLITAVGADAALELVLVCGWYHAISFAVKALRLPLEPGTRPIAAPTADTSPAR